MDRPAGRRGPRSNESSTRGYITSMPYGNRPRGQQYGRHRYNNNRRWGDYTHNNYPGGGYSRFRGANKRHYRDRDEEPASSCEEHKQKISEEQLASSLAELGGPACADRTKCDDPIDPISQLRIWDGDGQKRVPNYNEIKYLFSYREVDSATENVFIRGFAIESFQQIIQQAKKNGEYPASIRHPITQAYIPEDDILRGVKMVNVLSSAERIVEEIDDEDPTTWSLQHIRNNSGSSVEKMKKLSFSVFQNFFAKASIEIPEDCVIDLALKDLKALAKEMKGMYVRNFDAHQRSTLCPEGGEFMNPPYWDHNRIVWQYFILTNINYVLFYNKNSPAYLVKLVMYCFIAALSTVCPGVRERYADSFALDFDFPETDRSSSTRDIRSDNNNVVSANTVPENWRRVSSTASVPSEPDEMILNNPFLSNDEEEKQNDNWVDYSGSDNLNAITSEEMSLNTPVSTSTVDIPDESIMSYSTNSQHSLGSRWGPGPPVMEDDSENTRHSSGSMLYSNSGSIHERERHSSSGSMSSTHNQRSHSVYFAPAAPRAGNNFGNRWADLLNTNSDESDYNKPSSSRSSASVFPAQDVSRNRFFPQVNYG